MLFFEIFCFQMDRWKFVKKKKIISDALSRGLIFSYPFRDISYVLPFAEVIACLPIYSYKYLLFIVFLFKLYLIKCMIKLIFMYSR